MALSDDGHRSTSLRRLFRTAGAIAALTSIAGCSGPETGDTGSPGATATSAPTTTSTPTTPSPTPEPTPCEDRAADLEEAIARVEAEIESLEREVERDRRTATELRAIRDQYPGGWSAETIEAARAAGQSIRDGVVVLEFESGGGTGWFIDDHHVITNSHLADGDGRPTGWTIDGEQFRLRPVARDQDRSPDVAVLRTDFAGTALSTGSSSDLERGTPVVQVGHPTGMGNWLTSLGHFLYTEVQNYVGIDPTTAMYTSVPGGQRVGGAPLVTLDGQVVGLSYGATSRDENRPADEAPEPAEADVVDYEITPRVWSTHVPIETVRDHYEEWT